MPVQVKWETPEKTIVLSEAAGLCGWDEYYTALQHVANMARSVGHRVDLIIHGLPGSETASESTSTYLQHALRSMPLNLEMIVIVNQSVFAERIFLVLRTLRGFRSVPVVQMANTLEQAHQIIHQDRMGEVAAV